MILRDTFYKINTLKFQENVLEAEISIDAKQAIYEVHFPNNQVKPGVVKFSGIYTKN